MAEVVGLISGVITIVQVAGRLGSSTLSLKRLWDEVQNAPRSIQRHLDQLEILAPAINEIRAEYQHPKSIMRHDSAAYRSLEYCQKAVETLEASITDMKQQINSERREKRLISRLKVRLKEDTIQEHRQQLHSALELVSLSQHTYLIALNRAQSSMIMSKFRDLENRKGEQSWFQSISEDHDSKIKETGSVYQVRLQLPAWLLQKAWDFQVYRACNGWTFQLKTWNIRPYGADIFKFAELGRLDLIFEAFERKEASIYDRTPSGATLIRFAMQTGRLNVIKRLVQMGMRLTDENIVVLLIRNWYLSTSDKSEVMELFDLFKSGEGFSPWLDYNPETDPDIMKGDGLYESIFLFAGSGGLSRLLFSPADMVKGLEFGHSWEWLDPELPLDLLTEGSITSSFFRQKPVYREEKFGYDLYELLFHYFHMILNGWDVEVEHWRALVRGVFNGATPREVAQPWNLSKRRLPLLCRTLKDIWKRQFPLGAFTKWLARAVSMWLKDIADAGVDLEEYFLWEISTSRGDSELDPKIKLQRGGRILEYGPSLVILEHGKRPEDWLLEWDPCVEELVGEFWNGVETPNVPGAWVGDDDNEIEDGLTNFCPVGNPLGCILSSARYWSTGSGTGALARLGRVRVSGAEQHPCL
ncbi:hypothetical protein FDECE_12480 [Fusarium decemcellulare]|nr:hypothetical protein FDECE_12480 [Fusarium decemcellulare]